MLTCKHCGSKSLVFRRAGLNGRFVVELACENCGAGGEKRNYLFPNSAGDLLEILEEYCPADFREDDIQEEGGRLCSRSLRPGVAIKSIEKRRSDKSWFIEFVA